MATPTSLPIAFKVLTVNVHKGFTTFNRRFMLHELREAVRGVAADLVFLQEVQGSHQRHAQRVANFPQVPHYEFLADTIWSQYAYGRNAVYDNGDHGNALLSKFPITHYENHDISIRGRSGAACCIAFCSRRATTCRCMRCACTWGCRNRTASSSCSACAI